MLLAVANGLCIVRVAVYVYVACSYITVVASKNSNGNQHIRNAELGVFANSLG